MTQLFLKKTLEAQEMTKRCHFYNFFQKYL